MLMDDDNKSHIEKTEKKRSELKVVQKEVENSDFDFL